MELFYLETPREKKDPPPCNNLLVQKPCAGAQPHREWPWRWMQTNPCLFENLWLKTNIGKKHILHLVLLAKCAALNGLTFIPTGIV